LKADEVFAGVHGYLCLELWGKDKELRGFVKPQFFTRSGEEIALPSEFEKAIAAVTGGTACVGCSHVHTLACLCRRRYDHRLLTAPVMWRRRWKRTAVRAMPS
jgi:hypothetical protein